MLLDNSYKTLKKIFLDNIEICRDVKVLDAGCGFRGNFCGIDPNSYYGTDKDQRVIEYLKKSGTGFFSVMNINGLEFENEYFDYVTGVSFLHHLSFDDFEKAMSEV